MDAGRLDRRINLQTKSMGRAANGEPITTWNNTATAVPACIEYLRGKEFFAGSQTQSAVESRITIRHRSGITRDMRVVAGAESFDIVAIIPVGRKEWIELMCVSGVRNG